MKLNEIVGKLVGVKEKDENEWLGKVMNKDAEKIADNPCKHLRQDKFGTGYRVDFPDNNWRWHQGQEEVLRVALSRYEDNITESMKVKNKEPELLKESNVQGEKDVNTLTNNTHYEEN